MNNPTIEPEDLMRRISGHCQFRFCVFQKEKGAEGTPHYQGYVEFKRQVKLPAVKKRLGGVAHLEQRRGTAVQASTYCQKEDSRIAGPWFQGVISNPNPGRRTDLEAVYDMAKSGAKLTAIADAHPATYLRFHRGIDKVRNIHNVDKPPIRLDLQVVLYYGPPGCGKTRSCYEHDPGLYAIPLGKDIWYDNYQGQKTVLIDDFSGNIPLSQLLRLLDIYPLQVPCKGSFTWFRPMTILVTTNIDPLNWYDYRSRQNSLEALRRRFHRVYDMSEEKDCGWQDEDDESPPSSPRTKRARTGPYVLPQEETEEEYVDLPMLERARRCYNETEMMREQ